MDRTLARQKHEEFKERMHAYSRKSKGKPFSDEQRALSKAEYLKHNEMTICKPSERPKQIGQRFTDRREIMYATLKNI